MRIRELEKKLKQELKNRFGISSYTLFSGSYQGNKKLKGEHITILIPIDIKIDVNAVKELFQKFYGDIVAVEKPKTIFSSGLSEDKWKELILLLE